MSLAALIIRIGADTSDLDRGLTRANRNVEQFGRKIRPLGNSLARIGNSASMAAGSLSRLGGVMPGVVGGMGRVVGSIGAAGVVLGEATILTAGLTKGMRLLQSASVAVAASSAPAWLAKLATPAGLAIIGITALTAAVLGLKGAWDSLTGPGRLAKKVVEEYQKSISKIDSVSVLKEQTRRLQQEFDHLTKQLEAERARMRPVTLDVGGMLVTSTTGDPSRAKMLEGERSRVAQQMLAVGGQLAKVMPTAAEAAAEAWRKFQQKMEDVGTAMRQAVEGARPFTEDIGKAWDAALEAIEKRLASTVKRSEQQTNQLWEMRDALLSVFRVSYEAPLSVSEAARLIRPDHNLEAQRGLGRGLDPRRFLGDKMDFRPTKASDFFGDLKRVFRPSVPTDSKGNPLSAGTRTGMMLQAGAGAMGGVVGEMMQGIAMFGPLGAALPVVTAAFKALAPVLEPLVPIVEILGQMIASSLTPAIRFITIGLSFLGEALGWVIRGIGRLIDALPGVSAKGVINTGQAMIDAARSARKNALANDYATEKVNEFAGALSNIPRVLNLNALRHLVSGTSRPPTGPGGTGKGSSVGTGGPGQPMMSVGTVNIHINGATDPERTAEAVGRALDLRVRRGGTSRLAVALA